MPTYHLGSVLIASLKVLLGTAAKLGALLSPIPLQMFTSSPSVIASVGKTSSATLHFFWGFLLVEGGVSPLHLERERGLDSILWLRNAFLSSIASAWVLELYFPPSLFYEKKIKKNIFITTLYLALQGLRFASAKKHLVGLVTSWSYYSTNFLVAYSLLLVALHASVMPCYSPCISGSHYLGLMDYLYIFILLILFRWSLRLPAFIFRKRGLIHFGFGQFFVWYFLWIAY